MKRLFDRIVLILNGAALSLVGIALVDFLLHPSAGDYNFNSPAFRALAILVLTPLTLLVGFLIKRRVPGNIVGPLLIVWAGTVAYGSIREEVGPVLRFRKGNPLERQQIKWLALFAGVNAIYVLLGLIAYPLLTGGEVMNPGTGTFGVFFYLLNGLLPPAAIGISILRYRLWDIDLFIRRTLVYSILTVTLTLVYFGSVSVLHELFQGVTGESQSPIVTVLSTLAIAALFTPLRRYIQERIDRRFYRRKYDAERVLAEFSASLREKVDMDILENSILAVVKETLQPASSTLWLHRSDQQSSERNLNLKST